MRKSNTEMKESNTEMGENNTKMRESMKEKWDKTVIVTGGAGFIGSCMVRTLNDMGITDIIVVDNIASTEKWMNLRNKLYTEYVNKNEFISRLLKDDFGEVSGIIHMGACSSTTETDFDYLWRNNVEYTKLLWNYCADKQIPFLYASSAATYGNGAEGFCDTMDINTLRPLNGYGYSKQIFDIWAEKQMKKPLQYVGFKFFNVYGPNEYCKGSMASMVYHGYKQQKNSGVIKLFQSCNPKYPDGGQLRDFVYVKDVCRVIVYFMEHPEYSGLFNVGTGRAQSFAELISAVFHALNKEVCIEYIAMPEHLKEKYQYYTQADISKLRNVGYDAKFMDVESGVRDYVLKHLDKGFEIY